MAKEKETAPLEEEKNDKPGYRYDLLPEELKFICRRCHIAANKRMLDKLECDSVVIQGRLCENVERLRSTLSSQGSELAIYRKYASIFISDKFGERTVLQKSEIAKIYKDKVSDGKRSLEEFVNLLSFLGVEVVGN